MITQDIHSSLRYKKRRDKADEQRRLWLPPTFGDKSERKLWVPGMGNATVMSGTPASSASPLALITSVSFKFCLDAALGLTIGTGVSVWADQSPAGNHFTQSTGAAQPTLQPTSGPNSQPCIIGDGSDDLMIGDGGGGFTYSAPGTQPYFIWAIVRANSPINGRAFFGQSNTRACASWTTTGPHIRFNTGTNIQCTAAVNTWGRYAAAAANSTSVDYIQFRGASSGTGTSAGNNSVTTTPALFGVLGTPGTYSIAYIFSTVGIPSGPELSSVDAWASARFGSSVLG